MRGFPGGSVVKNPPSDEGNAGDGGSIPGSGSGRSPEGRNCNSLQNSCWDNTMDRGAWWTKVHGIAESDSNECLSMHVYINESE